jgi:hypothetical protein
MELTSALTKLVFPAPEGAATINKLPDIFCYFSIERNL